MKALISTILLLSSITSFANEYFGVDQNRENCSLKIISLKEKPGGVYVAKIKVSAEDSVFSISAPLVEVTGDLRDDVYYLHGSENFGLPLMTKVRMFDLYIDKNLTPVGFYYVLARTSLHRKTLKKVNCNL